MGIHSELKEIVRDIKDKTGVEIYFAPQGDAETKFTLRLGGCSTDAYIRGEGEQAERMAKLISYLVETRPHAAGDRRSELKSVVLGEGGSWRAIRFLSKYNLADSMCYALEIVPDRHFKECVQHVERCVNEGHDLVLDMDGERIVVVKFVEEDQSAFDFASFLARSLYEELGVKASVGVGCEMKGFAEIATSCAQAATALRMSRIINGEGEVHSYREYMLVRLLEDLPKARLKDYMEQFRIEGATEIFEDEIMTQTAEEFLESSLNISEASRNLFMHRNTLTYRLDKIERATGLNIRKFSDAVTFRVIGILYKLLQS